MFKCLEVETGRHVAVKRAKASKFEDGIPKDSFREIQVHKILKDYD